MVNPTCPDPAAPQPGRTSRWLSWLVLLGLGLAILLMPFPARASVPVQRTFHMDLRRFEYNPAVLRVNPGDTVTIDLVAQDVMHGIHIEGYGVEATASPGTTTRLSFTASRQGSFRFYCTITCGNMHPFMTGRLEVGQNTTLQRAMALSGLVLVAGVLAGRK